MMTKNRHRLMPFLLIALAILLTACGTTPPPVENTSPAPQIIIVTATPLPVTNTPDPCAPENIEAEVHKIHDHMREFDDASTLAGSILQGVAKGQMQMSDLSNTVPNLQRIRREAENQPSPSCLVNLKTYQINHMYSVLNSLNAFLSGDQLGFDQYAAAARQFHDQYLLELARSVGQTVVPIAPPTASDTPSP